MDARRGLLSGLCRIGYVCQGAAGDSSRVCHDQGHIPVKLLGFQIAPSTGTLTSRSGINVTLGLPIMRNSVDNGIAFDIAGREIASEGLLIEAIERGLQLAATRCSRAGSGEPSERSSRQRPKSVKEKEIGRLKSHLSVRWH